MVRGFIRAEQTGLECRRVTEPRAPGANAGPIGHRLRELRAARSLSLRQLAREVGVSPSLLSQVENGKVTPSVDTLYELAKALATPVAAFFDDAAASEPHAEGSVWLVRAGRRSRIALEHGVTWENLLPREQSGLRFMQIRYEPGAHSGDHLLRHPGRDLFLVLEGELTFRVGFGEYVLHPGDAISFADFEPHHLRNDGSAPASAVVCVIGDDEGGGAGESPGHRAH
jgi:transcriptional regulator with XRE-family HTH domain